MNIVIPMAGRGSRFSKAGYNQPKFLIEFNGKTLLEHSVDSLPIELADNLIFILLKEHENEWNVSNLIKEKYPNSNIKFIFLEEVTRGQSETVLKSEELINNDQQLLVYNIDTYFRSSSLKDAILHNDCDGIIGAFKDEEDKWSFAKVDDQGIVIKTTEKEPISNNALTGMYHFGKGSDFVRVAKQAINENNLVKNEFYIAPLYNQLIAEGRQFKLDMVDEFIALGTPEDLENAKAN